MNELRLFGENPARHSRRLAAPFAACDFEGSMSELCEGGFNVESDDHGEESNYAERAYLQTSR
jgi:hypothetical protein